MDKSLLGSEKLLQQAVINKILVPSTIAASLAYASAQIRALDLGWTSRGVFQFLAVVTTAILLIFRQKLKILHKALFLIILLSTGSVAGFCPLGFLPGNFLFSQQMRY